LGKPEPISATDRVEQVGEKCPAPPTPSWDQAAADALLVELRAEVARIEQSFRGKLPPALSNVLSDALAIAEGYVANHQEEAARGWDALELLRCTVRRIRRLYPAGSNKEPS
jgi:hypothetical protein